MRLHDLIEGRNDPHTHKAVFMIGGPGSGKTYISKALLGGTGLRAANVDHFYEYLRDKEGIRGKGYEDDLYKYSGNLTQKRMDTFLRGRLGLIVDGTGRNIDRLERIKRDLEKLGYDIIAVFVNTELNTALDRNDSRQRRVDPKLLRQMHSEVRKNLGAIQQLFGNNLLIIDNSEEKQDLTRAHRQIDKFLNAPHQRPVDWGDN